MQYDLAFAQRRRFFNFWYQKNQKTNKTSKNNEEIKLEMCTPVIPPLRGQGRRTVTSSRQLNEFKVILGHIVRTVVRNKKR